jgi:hypothetical protein
MVLLIIACTSIMGAITGLAFYHEGVFFRGLVGQILHSLLTIVCFALVALAFWRFGWVVGVINLALLFIAGNIPPILHVLEKL